jgi:hypothetical protein
MEENSTTAPEGNASLHYRTGDTIIFKFEGNIRARVTGHCLMNGKVWIEADGTFMKFTVPCSEVIGVEPMEED